MCAGSGNCGSARAEMQLRAGNEYKLIAENKRISLFCKKKSLLKCRLRPDMFDK